MESEGKKRHMDTINPKTMHILFLVSNATNFLRHDT